MLGETIVIILAEMANFSKAAEDCVTEVDKMLYLLKNIGRMMDQPGWLQHEVYTRIFDACEIAGFDEDISDQVQKYVFKHSSFRYPYIVHLACRLWIAGFVCDTWHKGAEQPFGRAASLPLSAWLSYMPSAVPSTNKCCTGFLAIRQRFLRGLRPLVSVGPLCCPCPRDRVQNQAKMLAVPLFFWVPRAFFL